MKTRRFVKFLTISFCVNNELVIIIDSNILSYFKWKLSLFLLSLSLSFYDDMLKHYIDLHELSPTSALFSCFISKLSTQPALEFKI